MSEKVFWSITATRSLEVAVYRQEESQERLHRLQEIMEKLLTQAFPDFTIFVLDRLGGFDATKPQHVLTIEVFPPRDQPANVESLFQHHSTHVVKVGLREMLDKEVAGWKSCLPHGLINDHVLLPIYDRPATMEDDEGRCWSCLLYADATQTIGEKNPVSLEDAVINACQYQLPDEKEVAICARTVLDRLGDFFYTRAIAIPLEKLSDAERLALVANAPATAEKSSDRVGDHSRTKLQAALNIWHSSSDCGRAYQSCLQTLPRFIQSQRNSASSDIGQPVDVVEAFDALYRTLRWLRDHPGDENASEVRRLISSLPEVTRGCAHGDLHGRNILLGQDGRHAVFPTVFDFETSGSQLLIGWDPLKLECELNYRTMAALFGGQSDSEFLLTAFRFNARLAELTQKAIQTDWKSVLQSLGTTPTERLLYILLTIREEASEVFMTEHQSGGWYEEYLFLLGLYCVSTSRYQHSFKMRLGALAAGSIATGQSRWFQKLSEREEKRFQQAQNTEKADISLPSLPNPNFTWRFGYAYAKRQITSADPSSLKQAISLLDSLIGAFPHVSLLYEDLAYAYIRDDQAERAIGVVHAASDRFDLLTVELHCRLGRLKKDEGCLAYDDQQFPQAIHHFHESLRQYSSAFDREHGYYPGINVAWAHLALAASYANQSSDEAASQHLREARGVATRVRDDLKETSHESLLDAWQWATLAEAYQILGESELAESAKKQFSNFPNVEPDQIASFERQRSRNEQLLAACCDGEAG